MGNRQSFRRVVISLIWALAGTVVAAEQSPDETLQAQGLKKVGRAYVLPEEVALSKKLREIEASHKKVIDAQKKAVAAEAIVDKKKEAIIGYIQQERQLRAQLNSVTNPLQHNRIVETMNELVDRIQLMEKSDKEEKEAKAARAVATEVGGQYVEQIIQLRRKYEEVKAKYDKIADDEKVKQALETLNKDAEQPVKLGPSSTFIALDRSLKKREGAVLTETIQLRRGDGDLWYVAATFNGQHSIDLTFDTGSSMMLLPYKTAVATGMTPSANDPTMTCQLADGHTVDCKLVYIQSVRVGNFTVDHVPCGVLPENCPEGSALLGMAFMKHFTYKMDNAKGLLHIAQIDMPGGKGRRVAKNLPHSDAALPDEPKPAEQTADAGKSTPEDVVAKLLQLDATATPHVLSMNRGDGSQIKFTSCKREPVANIVKRLGEPDEIQKMGGGGDGGDDEEAKKPWKMYSWGPLQLMVDGHGEARFYALAKGKKEKKDGN